MEILGTKDFSTALFAAADQCKKEFRVYSAFSKISAFETFSGHLGENVDGAVISRWSAVDLVSGVSDLEVYSRCKQRGWKFGINQTLHAKVYIFDDEVVFVGSGNLTGAGLGLSKNHNQELGVYFRNPKIAELENLSLFENETIWVDDDLFNRINAAVSEISESGQKIEQFYQWPHSLLELLEKPVSGLWISDLVSAMPNCLTTEDLQAKTPIGPEQVESFLSSRLYKWLKQELATGGTYTNFGWLSSRLQSALIDDPAPSRKAVKDFVRAIFWWVKICDDPSVLIQRFKHTVGLKLTQD
jgi:hypothetical protein